MTIENCHRCVGVTCQNQVVNECLPVNAFGDLFGKTVKVATIGLNPALNEFFTFSETKSRSQRLPILHDYGVTSRENLKDIDVEDAKQRRKNYFTNLDRKWHSYFEKLENFISRIQPIWSYCSGSVVHIDLVACATQKRWHELTPECKIPLLNNCREHFLRTLSQLPDGAILFLDGSTVVQEMQQMQKSGLLFKQKGNVQQLNTDGCLVYFGKIEFFGKTFRFWGWSIPVGKVNPMLRYNIASWVCDTMEPPLPFFPSLK